eukprot:4349689-Amphidinium_carterae.3
MALRPVRFTDRVCSTRAWRTGGVSRTRAWRTGLATCLPSLCTVKPALHLPLLLQTTKADDCRMTLLLAKRYLTQGKTHPLQVFLGGGRFKRNWFKVPGDTGATALRLGIVGARALESNFMPRQPFQHELCDEHTCSTRQATLPSIWDHVIFWRGSGPTYHDCPINGVLEHEWRCARHAAMQMCSRQRYCRLRAWNTGVDENVFFSTTWRTCLTRTTTLGRTWRAVQYYRTSPTGYRSISRVQGDVGKWTVPTVSTWPQLPIRLGTGAVVAVGALTQRTNLTGYTIVHSSVFVAITCADIAVSFRTAWMYRWSFARSTMRALTADARPSSTGLPPVLCQENRHGSAAYFYTKCGLENRSP